jgi:hypothetical protein
MTRQSYLTTGLDELTCLSVVGDLRMTSVLWCMWSDLTVHSSPKHPMNVVDVTSIRWLVVCSNVTGRLINCVVIHAVGSHTHTHTLPTITTNWCNCNAVVDES